MAIASRASALLLIGVVALTGCTDSQPDPAHPLANDQLAGAWRPVGVKPVAGSADRWRLVFEEAGTWHGIDACNDAHGVFKLFEDGTFEGGQSSDDFEGGVGCSSETVSYYTVLENTVRVDVTGAQAVFLSDDDDELMVLKRLT